jgi:hypothetical protein
LPVESTTAVLPARATLSTFTTRSRIPGERKRLLRRGSTRPLWPSEQRRWLREVRRSPIASAKVTGRAPLSASGCDSLALAPSGGG